MLTEQLVKLLTPMVGVRPDPGATQAEIDLIPADLAKTTTGLTLDQCHDVLLLSTIKKMAPEKVVLADYLTQVREDGVRALLTTLETRLLEASMAPTMLESAVLFTGSFGTDPPIIVKQGRTVGLLITPTQKDVTLILETVSLYGFFTDVEGFALSLTDLKTMKSETIPIPVGCLWHDVQLPLRAGRSYALTYKEADLGENNSARNTVTQWPKAKSACRGCQAGCVSSYAKIEGIADGVTTRTNNYGINIVLSAEGDVSGRLVDNPKRLVPALKQQIAVTFLEKIAYSKRKNADTEDARQSALFALTDRDNQERVPMKLDRALSSLVKALKVEASAALDINQTDDITWTTI